MAATRLLPSTNAAPPSVAAFKLHLLFKSAGNEYSHLMRVIIVGGGASSVLLACHLFKVATPPEHILIVERSPIIGCGVAYSTPNSGHLLNVRPGNMSAFSDDPNHFWRWLTSQCLVSGMPDQLRFMPRHIYGAYLQSLLNEMMRDAPSRLAVHHGECTALEMTPNGGIVSLDDGRSFEADIVVLATGNELPQARESRGRWWDGASPHMQDAGAILILGTGLTMIDEVQSIFGSGYRGEIVAMSRHGLIPQVHRDTKPLKLDSTDIPFGASASATMRWLRGLTCTNETEGGDWRSAIDSIRPYTQKLWMAWPETDRRRFLRHARAWWDVHRHRVAPEIDLYVRHVMAAGRLSVCAGKVVASQVHDGGYRVTYRKRGASAVSSMDVDAVVDCTGVITNPAATQNPAIRHVLETGVGRVDTLGIGIDVTPAGAVIDAAGRPSRRLFAVGPITRSALWETIAIPDIRLQCEALARDIVEAGR